MPANNPLGYIQSFAQQAGAAQRPAMGAMATPLRGTTPANPQAPAQMPSSGQYGAAPIKWRDPSQAGYNPKGFGGDGSFNLGFVSPDVSARADQQHAALNQELSRLAGLGYGPGTPQYEAAVRGFGSFSVNPGQRGGGGYMIDPRTGTVTKTGGIDPMARQKEYLETQAKMRAMDPFADFHQWQMEMGADPRIAASQGMMDQSRMGYASSLPMLQQRAMGRNSYAGAAGRVERLNAMQNIAQQSAMQQSAAGFNPALARTAIMAQGQVGADMASRIAAARAEEQMNAERGYMDGQLRLAGLDQAMLQNEQARWAGPAGLAMQGQGNAGSFLPSYMQAEAAQKQAGNGPLGMGLNAFGSMLGFGASMIPGGGSPPKAG